MSVNWGLIAGAGATGALDAYRAGVQDNRQRQAYERQQVVDRRADDAFARDQQFRQAYAEHLRARGQSSLGRLLNHGMAARPAATGPSASQMANPYGTPIAELAAAGAPTSNAWQRMVDADPIKAAQVESADLELTDDRLKVLSSVNARAVQMLAGVHDQPSFEAAKQRARTMYAGVGIDLDALGLPDAYSEEGLQQLMLSALDNDDQLAALRAERKLDWDIRDDELDNARADRNQTSVEAYRTGQMSNVRRGQDLADARGRRGQDIGSADRRRGQDITSGDRRRGQDTTSSDRRRGQDLRPGRRSNGDGAIIVNPRTGQRMKLQGGKWVPIS